MLDNVSRTGKAAYTVIAVVLGSIANVLGGFDDALRLLIVLIVADYITGCAVGIKS